MFSSMTPVNSLLRISLFNPFKSSVLLGHLGSDAAEYIVLSGPALFAYVSLFAVHILLYETCKISIQYRR